MIRVIKYLVAILFLFIIAVSIFIMVDNYSLAVERGISQTIICDQIRSSIPSEPPGERIQSVETCFTYNPQLLFYGQIIIIAVVIFSWRYVNKLAVSFVTNYNLKMKNGNGTHNKNNS